MHYFVVVIVPKGGDVAEVVDKQLDKSKGKHWDWYQIGGRFTGMFTDYDPAKDPANWEKCRFCGGTGERVDEVAIINGFEAGYCNGCSSDFKVTGFKGVNVKWPTQWKEYKGDVGPVAGAAKDTPSCIVTPDGKWYEANEDWGNCNKPTKAVWEKKREAALVRWEKKRVPALLKRFADHVAVVVDCHA